MAICPKRVVKPTTAKWFSFIEKLRATSFIFRMPNTSSIKRGAPPCPAPIRIKPCKIIVHILVVVGEYMSGENTNMLVYIFYPGLYLAPQTRCRSWYC